MLLSVLVTINTLFELRELFRWRMVTKVCVWSTTGNSVFLLNFTYSDPDPVV